MMTLMLKILIKSKIIQYHLKILKSYLLEKIKIYLTFDTDVSIHEGENEEVKKI